MSKRPVFTLTLLVAVLVLSSATASPRARRRAPSHAVANPHAASTHTPSTTAYVVGSNGAQDRVGAAPAQERHVRRRPMRRAGARASSEKGAERRALHREARRAARAARVRAHGSTGIRQASHMPDCDALIAIHEATGGHQWTDVEWMVDDRTSCCDWDGVSCNDDGRVDGLYLEEVGVRGDVPAALGELTALEELMLTTNAITSLPDEMERLVNLVDLTASDCGPVREVPFLGKLVALEWLDLSHCALERLPDDFGQLKALDTAFLEVNALVALPDSLVECEALTWLDVSTNRLTALPDALDTLSILDALVVYENEIRSIGVLPASVSYLDAFDNNIESIDDSVFSLPLLESLDIDVNNMRALPATINLPSMVLFRASDNYIASLPSGMVMPLVEDMAVSGNELTELPDFVGFDTLRSFDAELNNLGSLPPSLTQLPALERLEVAYNRIASMGPIGSPIIELGVAFNELTVLPSLATTALRQLRANHNSLTAFPAGLAGAPRAVLEVLNLANNMIAAVGVPSEVTDLPVAWSVDLSNNRLSGPLPTALLTMSAIVDLHVGGNLFSGVIPSVALAPTLRGLRVQNNALEGPLPTTLNTLTSLDVSSNPVGGEFPFDLLDAPSALVVLDISSCQIGSRYSFLAPTDFHNERLSTLRMRDNPQGGIFSFNSEGSVMWDALSYVDAGECNFGDVRDTHPLLTTVLLDHNHLSAMDPLAVDLVSIFPAVTTLRLDTAQLKYSRAISARWGDLPLQSLNITNSGLVAGSDGVCLDLGQGDDRQMCFPDWLEPTLDWSTEAGNAAYVCLGLQIKGQIGANVLFGPEYYSQRNCKCIVDYYYLAAEGETVRDCRPCPDNAVCPGLELAHIALPAEDYYPSPSKEAPRGYVKCKLHGICSQDKDNIDMNDVCITGHTGRLCAACEDEYFSWGLQCRACGSASVAWLVPTFFLLVLLAFLVSLYRVKRSGTGHVKIFLFYVQTLRLIPSMGVVLPSSLLGLTQAATSFSMELVGVECVVSDYGVAEQFWFTMLLPVVCGVIVVLVWSVRRAMMRYAPEYAHNAWIDLNVRVFLFLVYACLYALAKSIFTILPCESDEFDGQEFFSHYPATECDGWTGARVGAMVFVFVYVAGIPIALGYLLWSHHGDKGDSGLDNETMQARLGFLYESYKPDFWWWEGVIALRRVVIVMCIALSSSQSAFLPLIMVAVFLVSMMIQRAFLPYKSDLDNNLEYASLAVLLMSYSIVIAFFNDELNNKGVLAGLLVLLNVAALTAFLTVILRAKVGKGAAALLRRASQKVPSVAATPTSPQENADDEGGLSGIAMTPVEHDTPADNAETHTEP